MQGTKTHHALCSAALVAWVVAQGLGGWLSCAELCSTLSEKSRSAMEWLAEVEERLDKQGKYKHMELVTPDGCKVVLHWLPED